MKFHALEICSKFCLSFSDYTASIGQEKSKVNKQTYTLPIQNSYFSNTKNNGI